MGFFRKLWNRSAAGRELAQFRVCTGDFCAALALWLATRRAPAKNRVPV